MKSKMEGLEGRRMLAAPFLRVGAVTADNRGEVVIQLSERATGIKGAAAQIYTAGTDGVLFTNDDVRQNARISYSTGKKQIKLTANLPKDTPYRVKLDGKSRIRAEDDGSLLDGNFTGSLASGDGIAGGNFEAVFNRDTSSTPLVKMRTSEGDITLRMRYDVAPISTVQFLTLANQSKFDNMVISRSIPGFVLQLGAYQITGDGADPEDVITNSAPTFPEELPRVLSNLRGTLSFARGAGLASNQFFINLGNNDATSSFNNLDTDTDLPAGQDDIFTPFAQIFDEEGFDTIDRMAAKDVVNLSSQVSGLGNAAVQDAAQAQAGLNPYRDLVVFYRTAVVMKISAK